MPRMMKLAALVSLTLFAASAALFYRFGGETYLTLTIASGTTFYHLGVRLGISALYRAGMRNRADYTKQWYRPRAWEAPLYRFLRVKAWKGKMPTYDIGSFSRGEHTWEEIAQAMCQSELVHETNIVASFLPVLASRQFGAFGVFLITSVCAAAFDLLFVILQRYNRSRVIRLLEKRRSDRT